MRLIQALFLKGLALVYFAAFASLLPQIVGLVGADGILPLAERQAIQAQELGWERLRLLPGLFWIDGSDAALEGAAVLGCLLSVPLFLGWWPRLNLIALYLLYLSLHHGGGTFLGFQWDALLLEAGFLAIFMAHGGPRLAIWLMVWLLFRLRFQSGLAKLISGDPMWADWSAVQVYFEVQPLPHVGAWYAHQLPDVLLTAGAGLTLVVELLVPLLFLAPRRWRFVGAWLTIGFQVLILATSNHAFLNLLTLLLCLFLFDDKAVLGRMPSGVAKRLTFRAARTGRLENGLFAVAAVVVLVGSTALFVRLATGIDPPRWIGGIADQARALRMANAYHVFPTMKPERIEVVLEATWNGEDWHPVRFRCKPGDPGRAPAFVVPHHPRLDWLLWFTPMGHPIFVDPYLRLVERLREGSPAVIGLLDDPRFEAGPPQALRGSLWRYRFTDPETREKTGDWWTMEWVGPFPPHP